MSLPPSGKRTFIAPLEGGGDAIMRFRLTYVGDLRPTQRDSCEKDTAHKLDIRRVFHGQLRQLWRTNHFLRSHTIGRESDNPWSKCHHAGAALVGVSDGRPMWEVIAESYQRDGFRYVPLVRDEISLLCSLSIVLLRRDGPGSVISAGDLDNRIKTLIDCLKIPKHRNELPSGAAPKADEDPFFVLLEDDNQVTGLTVETDVLLEPTENGITSSMKTHLLISVELRPYDTNFGPAR